MTTNQIYYQDITDTQLTLKLRHNSQRKHNWKYRQNTFNIYSTDDPCLQNKKKIKKKYIIHQRISKYTA